MGLRATHKVASKLMSNNGQPLIKPKVLVVDDERERAVTFRLVEVGFDVQVAALVVERRVRIALRFYR